MQHRGLHLGALFAGLALLASPPEGMPVTGECRSLEDAFDTGLLDPGRWLFTSAGARGPVRQEVVGHRLRVRTAASGPDAGATEYAGVVHPHLLAVGGLDVAVEVDWAAGIEGGATASLYLAPVLTWSSPEREPDWLKFEYETTGSGGLRAVLAVRREGDVQLVAAEARSSDGAAGRRIGPQALRLELAGTALRVFENGVLWHESADIALPFRWAYLYLQMSGRRDGRPGHVFFDEVRARAACGRASPR